MQRDFSSSLRSLSRLKYLERESGFSVLESDSFGPVRVTANGSSWRRIHKDGACWWFEREVTK